MRCSPQQGVNEGDGVPLRSKRSKQNERSYVLRSEATHLHWYSSAKTDEFSTATNSVRNNFGDHFIRKCNKGRLSLAEPPLLKNSPLDCFLIHPLSERPSVSQGAALHPPEALPLDSAKGTRPFRIPILFTLMILTFKR